MAKKKDGIERKKVTHELEFKLTTKDFEERGKEAAEVAKDIGDKEREFKIEQKKWKGQIGEGEAKLNAILQTIRNGTEMREVECIEEKNFADGTVSYIHKGEVLHSRAMEPHERQAEMKLAPQPEAPKATVTKIGRRKRDVRAAAAGDDKEEDLKQVIREERSKNKPDLTV